MNEYFFAIYMFLAMAWAWYCVCVKVTDPKYNDNMLMITYYLNIIFFPLILLYHLTGFLYIQRDNTYARGKNLTAIALQLGIKRKFLESDKKLKKRCLRLIKEKEDNNTLWGMKLRGRMLL